MSEKKIQLFCMPFAGGNAAALAELCSFLDESVDAHVIEYPGRGTRSKEAFCETMDALISDARNQVIERRISKLPFALLGYSMGVEVAFDLTQYGLLENPVHLFCAARESIQYDTRGHEYSLLDMDEFVDRIISLGGIDERIIKNRRFLEIYMQPIYADYRLLYQYAYKPEKGNLVVDLTVFYCEEDTSYRKVNGWKSLTSGKTEFYEFGNNHFFIQQHAKEMANIINTTLLNKTDKYN